MEIMFVSIKVAFVNSKTVMHIERFNFKGRIT